MSTPWGQPIVNGNVLQDPNQVPLGTNPPPPPGYTGMPPMMMSPYPGQQPPPYPQMSFPGQPFQQPHPGPYYPGQPYPPPYQQPGMPVPEGQFPIAAAAAPMSSYHLAPQMPQAPVAAIPPPQTFISTISSDSLTADQLKARIEASLGSARLTTAFVGNIADGITDELLTNMFTACGPLKKWKRVLDVSGTPKSFGFIEFISAEGLQRLLRLLPDIVLLGKALNIKVDDQTKDYLKKFQDAIKNYEATNPDSPRLSFTLEDDLKTLDEISALLSEKKLTSGLQFVENRIKELTLGPSEKPKIILEHPRPPKTEEKEKPGSKASRQSAEKPRERERTSLTGWETAGYRDRERRWEKREAEMERSRKQDAAREAERVTRSNEGKQRTMNYLASIDDTPFFLLALEHLTRSDRSIERKLASLSVSQFYMERSDWRERRRRELQRQLEYDEREAQREAESVEKNVRVDRVLDSLGKRPLLGHDIRAVSKRPRMPLLAIEYSYEDLIAAGYNDEAARAKLQELRKDKIKKLVEKIPINKDQLFSWDLDWDLVEVNKALGWIQKNLELISSVRDKANVGKWLEQQLLAQKAPPDILGAIDMPKDEAEVFLVRLWRYLVYESEATAYELN